MSTILVTGGTGRIGSELVRLLASHPAAPAIRVVTRSPDGPDARVLRQLAPGRVQTVRFDDEAVKGIDGLMLIAPFSPDMAAWHQQVLRNQPEQIPAVLSMEACPAALY